MSQFKIYAQRPALLDRREGWSQLLHAAAVDVLGLPADKRFHRFFPMDPVDFPTPPGRSDQYTIIEVVLFSGRAIATKKALFARVYADAVSRLDVHPVDLEIVLLEAPRSDWGIRGLPGDELPLTYEVAR